MSKDDNKRFYWLKLDKDFFKRHDITIIEGMPNGKDYILFYLKLLCESTSHEGYLRFSPTIPYNEEMLSRLTRTNIDIVRSAIKIFTELNMMAFLDDGTLYLEQVQKMIGSETGSAIRKREYREQIEGTNGGKCPQEIRDKRLEKDNSKSKFASLTATNDKDYPNNQVNKSSEDNKYLDNRNISWEELIDEVDRKKRTS